jgi:hypothetical protein
MAVYHHALVSCKRYYERDNHHAPVCNQDVDILDIKVHYVAAVHVRDCARQLPPEEPHYFDVHHALGLHEEGSQVRVRKSK